MSVASEFPPDVYIPAAARPRSLRLAPAPGPAGVAPTPYVTGVGVPTRSFGPAAPAAAAIGAGVVDLDRWRHHDVGAQVGDRRRIDADLRTRPSSSRAPSAAPVSLRLTRRGLSVALAATALVAMVVVLVAWLSAPASAASGRPGGDVVSAGGRVTVQAGDSLWTIATAVAPHRDPRAEVADLERLNHLTSDALTPGQQLRVR